MINYPLFVSCQSFGSGPSCFMGPCYRLCIGAHKHQITSHSLVLSGQDNAVADLHSDQKDYMYCIITSWHKMIAHTNYNNYHSYRKEFHSPVLPIENRLVTSRWLFGYRFRTLWNWKPLFDIYKTEGSVTWYLGGYVSGWLIKTRFSSPGLRWAPSREVICELLQVCY